MTAENTGNAGHPDYPENPENPENTESTENSENTENTENTENPEYDGMGALMAAILDEPLPARALRDPAFMAAHRAAAADVAVLREQLALMGDALAASDGTAPAGADAAGPAAAGTERSGAEQGDASADGSAPSGRARAARPGNRPEAGPAGHSRSATESGDGTGDTETPHAPVRPRLDRPRATPGSRGPHRAPAPHGTRRPFKVALGALAAAAAATVVVGMGWLVTQPGGSSDDAGSKAAADSSAGDQKGGGVLFGSPRYLACARLVAEGTVSKVEPLPSGDQERITLKVSRFYKNDGAKTEITFPVMTAGRPRLHVGDLVLVGLPRRDQFPDTVIVGEGDIAPERARLTASLPESRTLTCG